MAIALRRFRPFIALVAALPFAAIAQPLTPPRLEIDYTGGSIPLSPLLSAAIAIAIAAMGVYALRRTRARARLPVAALLAIAAGSVAMSLAGVRLIERAQASIPVTTLALAGSPTVFTAVFVGDVHVVNALGQPVTITGVSYDTGSYDFFIDATSTTCIVGTTLLPGQVCNIRILSLG